MDFELHYTPEQEAFRKEVRAWLNANIPKDYEHPHDPEDITYEQFKIARAFRRKLGQKGYLAPTYPKEYGGGGYDMEHAMIIEEELAERDEMPRVIGDNGLALFIPAILVWGSEEQKKKFLPGMLKGEVITWQGYTEPDAGSDLASLKTRAARDGNDYIINGEKIFIGADYDVEYIFTLAVTDPTKPRHHNIGAFMVPANLPGIKKIRLNLFAWGGQPGKQHVFFEDVRVPAGNLIGHETNGWQVTQSVLEVEHGGLGGAVQRNRLFENMMSYIRETEVNGQPLSKDPDVQQEMLDVFIRNEVSRLIGLRNYWMHHAKKHGVGYEGSQTSQYRKSSGIKTAAAYQRILGPSALIKDPKWSPLKGAVQVHQREGICTHPGGTIEVQKLIMARRMGISRTKEKAAALA